MSSIRTDIHVDDGRVVITDMASHLRIRVYEGEGYCHEVYVYNWKSATPCPSVEFTKNERDASEWISAPTSLT